MNVLELKYYLEQLIEDGKGNSEIIISKDAEGNEFKRISEITLEYCYDNEPVHPDDIGAEFDKDELVENIVIWPV